MILGLEVSRVSSGLVSSTQFREFDTRAHAAMGLARDAMVGIVRVEKWPVGGSECSERSNNQARMPGVLVQQLLLVALSCTVYSSPPEQVEATMIRSLYIGCLYDSDAMTSSSSRIY